MHNDAICTKYPQRFGLEAPNLRLWKWNKSGEVKESDLNDRSVLKVEEVGQLILQDISFPIPPESDDVGMSGDVEMSGDVKMSGDVEMSGDVKISGDVEMSDGNRVRGGGVSRNYTLLSLRQFTSVSQVLPCGSSRLVVRDAYKEMDVGTTKNMKKCNMSNIVVKSQVCW